MSTDDEPLIFGALSLQFLIGKLENAAELERICGHAVFVHASGGVRRPRPLEVTQGFWRRDIAERAPVDTITGTNRIFIAPIRKKTAASPVITVGRAPSNDIIVADVTLSKLHAFIRETPAGFVLEDAGSKNGTLVDNVPVAVRGNGPAAPLKPSSTVRFGSVSLTFLPIAALSAFLRAAPVA